MIGKRNPRAAIEARLPLVEDDVLCLSCTTPFTIVRRIGVDLRTAVYACPTCGERNAEIEKDAPWQLHAIH